METVKIRCKDLMVGDYIANRNGSPMQIVAVDEDNAYACEGNEAYACEGNEERPWIFGDDEGYEPEPIILTPEILEKNGWKEAEYWHEYQDGRNTIQCCLPDMRGRINGIEIENFKCEYVHQYQHLLRLCGLNELADNFKI